MLGPEAAAVADAAVPMRLVNTHTVSGGGDRHASDECKIKEIIRSIEFGLACKHPNWLCMGDWNGDPELVGRACKRAAVKFGLTKVPTLAGDKTKGKDFFIGPHGFSEARCIETTGYGDNSRPRGVHSPPRASPPAIRRFDGSSH